MLYYQWFFDDLQSRTLPWTSTEKPIAFYDHFGCHLAKGHQNHQNPSAFYMVFEIPGFPNSGPKIHFWSSKKQRVKITQDVKNQVGNNKVIKNNKNN